MTQAYDASAIEVLTGLEPVRKRPGMYTDTQRPNHLAQEVIDNSVDEAISGHAKHIDVVLHADGSLAVTDDGRGMPVDTHKGEGVSGVEVILTRLHAGGKFSNRNYDFSGGLHGVGVSVVNALSKRLEVYVRRVGKEHRMTFADGQKTSELKAVGSVGARITGTTVHFWPDERFFDSPRFNVPKLKHVMRAKAVLCPGLKIAFSDESDPGNSEQWYYEDGLKDYLLSEVGGQELIPADPFVGHFRSNDTEIDWAIAWAPENDKPLMDSYVNLVPTPQDGTHVNGFRQGLTDALREFCEFRNLLPRGLKIAPEDVWGQTAYVLSCKLRDPQFSGQTKERLTSREAAALVGSVVKDSFAQWLMQHMADAQRIANLAIDSAQERQRTAKRVERKKIGNGPALPGKLADCLSTDLAMTELFLVEGDSAGGSAKQARDRNFQAIMPLRGKILNTWEVDSAQVLASQEVHDIAVALGVDPGSSDLSSLRYGKVCILADADSDGAHIATLLCALFVRHFRPLVAAGHVYVAMPPLFRVDVGQTVYYALDADERRQVLERIQKENPRARPTITRFKGLGEMNPLQLRETVMDPNTRRLVQLEIASGDDTNRIMDMMLAKKRAADRKEWLEKNGNKAEVT
ncbi:MAG: DNA topoisomerase IV subunit B [Acidiferrobacterales bacterium]